MEKVKYGIVIFLFAILNSSCSDNSTGTKNNNGDAGSLKVTITTEGPDSDDYDQNGYKFSIENHSQEVSIQDNFTIENLSVGNHEVELNDLANNCELTNETPIEVEISSESITNLDLKIKCNGILKNKIVYIGNSFFEREIFTMDPDGNNKTVITDEAKRYEDIVFSPEGTKIAYTDEDGINIVSSENNEPIYNFGGQNDHGPEFSPNGSIIVYTSGVGDDSRSYLLNQEEGWPSSRLLSEIGNEYEVQITPTFSPNGEVVAFAARSRNQDPVEHDIYTTNINSNSSPTKLTTTGNNRNPIFTEDGNHIIYQSSISGSGQTDTDIKMINLNNKEITNLTDSEEFNDHSPIISSDGSKIAFLRSKPSTNGNAETAIYLINLDEIGNIIRLTVFTTGYISLGNFSPDNNSIVFVKTDSERQEFEKREIYKVQINGSGNTIQLTNNSNYEANPVWSPVK